MRAEPGPGPARLLGHRSHPGRGRENNPVANTPHGEGVLPKKAHSDPGARQEAVTAQGSAPQAEPPPASPTQPMVIL